MLVGSLLIPMVDRLASCCVPSTGGLKGELFIEFMELIGNTGVREKVQQEEEVDNEDDSDSDDGNEGKEEGEKDNGETQSGYLDG